MWSKSCSTVLIPTIKGALLTESGNHWYRIVFRVLPTNVLFPPWDQKQLLHGSSQTFVCLWGKFCLRGCHAEKSRHFGLWQQEEIEIRGGVSCWVCSRLLWLLSPLSQEPNTKSGHQHRAGECEEFSQHICSLLCTFSLLQDVKRAAGAPWMRAPCLDRVSAFWPDEGAANDRVLGAIWLMGRGERQEWLSAERVSHPGQSCCHSASTTKFRSFIFVTAPAEWNVNPHRVDQRFWHEARPEKRS